MMQGAWGFERVSSLMGCAVLDVDAR